MSNQSISSAVSKTPTLSFLPTEIRARICSFMDIDTAIFFACTSRRSASMADTRIWRDLELALPIHFGTLPLIEPMGNGDESRASNEWRSEEGRREEIRHRDGVSRKLRTIMLRINEKRSEMVKAVRIVPRAGVVNAQIHLLELVSPFLRALKIESSNRKPWQACSAPLAMSTETLDSKVLGYTLHFPALTRIHIGEHAIHFVGLLSLLVSASPNLLSLDVGYTQWSLTDDEEPPYPMISRATQITQFRLSSARGCERYHEIYDARHIMSLLRYSPSIRSLCIDLDVGGREELELREGADAVRALPVLQDLQSAEGLNTLQKCHGGTVVSLTARRLVLRSGFCWDMFGCLPDAPSLEVLIFDTLWTEPNLELPPSVLFPKPTIAQAMIPTFSSSLRRLSKLHTIHRAPISDLCRQGGADLSAALDQVLETGLFTCVIRSITYRGSEMLQARTLNNYRQTGDISKFLPSRPWEWSEISYTDSNGSDRVRSFQKLPKPIFTDYTDFEGHVVPLAIIEQIQIAEGAEEEEWEGRGIEVGAVAWKVLTDWRDGLVGAGTGAD